MTAKIVPNTFQCFNVYVDRAMQHLTDSELRVLLFATRHILGWQDKIEKRRARISLSMFVKGYKTTAEDGSETLYAGCGLGEAAVRNACNSLAEFGFLKRIGHATEKGQAWQIGDNPRWDKLEKRTSEQQEKHRQQVEKATKASSVKRKGVTSNVTPTSNDTTPLTSNDTTPLTSNDTQTKPSQSHEQNHVRTRAPAKDYDDVPKSDRLDIIRSWATSLSIEPANAYSKEANHTSAAEIFRAGYRGHQVMLFVKAKMQDNWWRDKTLTLANVAEFMPAWLQAKKAKPSPINFEEHKPLYPPRQEFSEEAKERIRQMRREALQ